MLANNKFNVFLSHGTGVCAYARTPTDWEDSIRQVARPNSRVDPARTGADSRPKVLSYINFSIPLFHSSNFRAT